LIQAPATLLINFGLSHREHNDKAKTPFAHYSPTTNVDLLKTGVELQLIPFIILMAKRAEQSSTGEPRFTSVEAENLVEILDKVSPIL
jgi:hypothetical protein